MISGSYCHAKGIITYNMNDVVNRDIKTNLETLSLQFPNWKIFIVLPFLGFQSKVITQQLKYCIYKFYGCFNLKIIFRNTRRIKCFPPTRTCSAVHNRCLRWFTRQAAGTVMIFIFVKQSVDYTIERLKILRSLLKTVTLQPFLITLLPRVIILNGIILIS